MLKRYTDLWLLCCLLFEIYLLSFCCSTLMQCLRSTAGGREALDNCNAGVLTDIIHGRQRLPETRHFSGTK